MKNKKKIKDTSFYTELKKLGIDFEIVENPPEPISKSLKQNGNNPNDMVVGRFFSKHTEEEIIIRLSSLFGSEIQEWLNENKDQ